MNKIISILAGLAITTSVSATESDMKLTGFGNKKISIMDDVTVGAVASDVHGQNSYDAFLGDMWQPGRKLVAGILTSPSLNQLQPAEVIAKRRHVAKHADFWIVPINSVAVGSEGIQDYMSHLNNITGAQLRSSGELERTFPNLEFQMPLILDGRFSPEERRDRLMTTADQPGVMVCNNKSAMGSCVHLVNIDSGTNPLPKWVVPDRKQFELIKNLGSQLHAPIDAVYAVIVKPTRRTVAMVNGMPAVEGEVVQGVLINTRTMTPLIRFNQDYKTLGKNNPLIAF